MNEGLLLIMYDGIELEGFIFLDGKEVVFINVEKMKVKCVKKMWMVWVRLSDYGYLYVRCIWFIRYFGVYRIEFFYFWCI